MRSGGEIYPTLIRQNPIKAGRPEQHWPFVKTYDGWLPGQWKGPRRS